MADAVKEAKAKPAAGAAQDQATENATTPKRTEPGEKSCTGTGDERDTAAALQTAPGPKALKEQQAIASPEATEAKTAALVACGGLPKVDLDHPAELAVAAAKRPEPAQAAVAEGPPRPEPAIAAAAKPPEPAQAAVPEGPPRPEPAIAAAAKPPEPDRAAVAEGPPPPRPEPAIAAAAKPPEPDRAAVAEGPPPPRPEQQRPAAENQAEAGKALVSDRPPEQEKPVEAEQKLTPEQKYFTDFYQQRMLDMSVLAQITPHPQAKPGESQEDQLKDYQKLLAERAQAIRAEMGQQDATGSRWLRPPQFGQATQAAYKDYLSWLEKKELPSQVAALQSLEQPLTGNPIEVPIENGRRIDLLDYQNRIATGKLAADLHVDPTRAPTMEQAQKIEDGLDWRNRAKEAADAATLQRWDDKATETIKTSGMPEGWLYQPGQDKNAWRLAVGQMIDLTTSVGRLANVIDKLHLPIDLPPGAVVTTGKNGSNIALDLPKDLRWNDPAAGDKIRQLQQYQNDTAPKIAAVREKLAAVAANPNLAISWGDTPLLKVKDASGHEVSAMVRLDGQERLLGVVDPTKVQPKPGETFREANLLEQRFTARTDPKTGEIIVRRSVQAQEVPSYSYQNAIYENVGKPADLRDSLSTDAGRSGQVVNAGDRVIIKASTGSDNKPLLAPDGKAVLDVVADSAQTFQTDFRPGTNPGLFAARVSPPGEPGKPAADSQVRAPEVRQDGLHLSTKENPITTAKDIVFPDGTRLPAGSKFAPGTLFDGESFKSIDPVGKVWATTPDGKMIQVADNGDSTTLPCEQRFKPDELVAVNKGSGTEFMLARDLENYACSSWLVHYGENALMATMDVAMVATGTVEISAAVKGARLLAAGTEVAGLTPWRVAGSTAKGAWDVGLGLGGLSSNAAISSTEGGREFAWYRNAAFLSTMAYGVAAPRIQAMRFSRLAEAKPIAETAPEQVAQIGTGERAGQAAGEAHQPTAAARPGEEASEATGASAKRGAPESQAGESQTAAPAARGEAPRLVRADDGAILGTDNGAGTARAFSYVQDAAGERAVNKITVGSGNEQMILERSASVDHEWTIHRPDGSTAKMQADIKVNDDGSYTVSHLTGEQAAWYGQAYHAGPPEQPLVRDVTYHPDGKITTEGMTSGYKPPEGSTYGKEDRFGEFWTAPDGKQTWIDGEHRIWNETSTGIWRSKDGMLAENREFVKKEPTKAIQLTEPITWTDTVNGKKIELTSGPNDYKVDNGDGTFYVVEKSVFERTYEPAPGQENHYIKKPVKARQLTEEQSAEIQTRAGDKPAKKGDYLVTGVDGETYVVEENEFKRLYKENTNQPADATPFSLPTPTGQPETLANGNIATPYANGQIIWNQKGDAVTITDTAAGTFRTYSGSEVFNSGTRFYFNGGGQELITNAGLRFAGGADGVLVGEDGAVLRDVPRPESSPIVSDPTPTRFSDSAAQPALSDLPGIELPGFTKASDGPPAIFHVEGREFQVTPHGTEWSEPGGSKFMIDSRSRVWQESNGQWSNANGTFKVDEQGQHWTWKDGSADWIDSDGRNWHHSQEMPAGHWRTEYGATYEEGTWQYTRRSKDDAHTAEILAGLRAGALSANIHASASAPNTNAPAGATPNQDLDTAAAANSLSSEPVFQVEAMTKGSWARATEETAGKAMFYSMYPMLEQQLQGIATQAKDIAGEQLQDMGFQLSQMWAPSNPYAQAYAIKDYDQGQSLLSRTGTAAGLPAPQLPATRLDDPKKAADTVLEYKQLLTEKLGATDAERTTKEQITQIFDKLAHAVSPDGKPEEREALKQELAAKVTFRASEIARLEAGLGEQITSQQIRDLMDPDRRAKFSNQNVAKLAAKFLASKDSNIVAASEMALLYLSRQTDGGAPHTVASAKVDYFPNAPLRAAASTTLRAAALTPLEDSRSLQVDLDPALLENGLRRSLETTGKDGRGIAIGDLLVKRGALIPQEFGTVLQNVLSDPTAPIADKMRALSDANGPRMAALIGGLLVQEQQIINNKNLTAEQQMSIATNSFGTTSVDFEKTLLQSARNDPDANVRAMSAAMLYSLKVFAANPREGAKLLQRLSNLHQNDIGDMKGVLSKEASGMLSQELSAPLPATPGQQRSDAIDRRLAAAQSYNLLAAKAWPDEAKSIQQQIARSLSEALDSASSAQTNKIADALLPDPVKQLDAGAAEHVREAMIGKIKAPSTYSAQTEQQLVSLLDKMPAVLNGAASETKNALYLAASDILENAPGVYSDLRSAAIAQIGNLGAQDAIPTLEKLAASDNYPTARLAALKALEQLKDPGLSALVASLTASAAPAAPGAPTISATEAAVAAPAIPAAVAAPVDAAPAIDAPAPEAPAPPAPKLEGDPNVLSYLRDLQYRLTNDNSSSAYYAGVTSGLLKFQASINDRYPSLTSFDDKAQKDWLEQKFPLLIRANFDKDVVQESRGKRDWLLGRPTDEGGEAVEKKRAEQFQGLVELAQSNSEQAPQARQILLSIITGNGGTIGTAENIRTEASERYILDGPAPAPVDAFYQEKSHNWAADAATALGKTAAPGFTGRDLTARLISMALASGIQGAAREELLKAWDQLGSPQAGVRAIPEALYQYIKALKR